MPPQFVYDIPSSILLFILIVVFLAIALIGLYIFTILTLNGFDKKFNDTNTGTYIGAIVVAMALIISFIITDEYQTYSETSDNLIQEANVLYLLAETVKAMPDTEAIQNLIIEYICSIINVEFMYMEQGEIPPDNVALDSLQAALLDYNPLTPKDQILYSKALDQLNLAIALRNSRLQAAVVGIPNEFWWLLIIGFAIIIILSWFVSGFMLYRIFMISFITIIYATLIFLVVALEYPFKGSLALASSPFQFVLDRLGVTCPPIVNSITVKNKEKFINKQRANKRPKPRYIEEPNVFSN